MEEILCELRNHSAGATHMSKSRFAKYPSHNMHNFSTIFKDANIRNSLTQFTESHLDRVEIAIEDSEAAALAYLAKHS